MTRRDLLWAATCASISAAPQPGTRLALEGYIFQQYAESRKKPLREVLSEVFTMARVAGFKNIELSPSFFTPDMREECLSLLRTNNLAMPSVYVGGAMHETAAAEETITRALDTAAICQPFGCKAVVNNPDPKHDGAEKTDAELAVQADSLNSMGKRLSQRGFELRIHHHTPQLVSNAREWRHILHNTDPDYVHICVDVDWAYEGGFEAVPFLSEVGSRLRELHIRSAKNKIWLEDLEDSDIDYRKVASYLKSAKLQPLLVVELAYLPATVSTRSLGDDLTISLRYAESIFGR